MKYCLSIIVAFTSMTGLISCVNTSTSQKISQNVQNTSSILENTLPNERHSYYDDFKFSSIKYYNQKTIDDEGNPILQDLSGIEGRFYWENSCLFFVSNYSRVGTEAENRATPILPYEATKWDLNTQTLTIAGTNVKMGQLIRTNGSFGKNLPNKEGKCWENYTVEIGTMNLTVVEE